MQTDTCRTVVKEKALLWVLIGIENSESKFAGREMHPAKCVCNVKLEPLTANLLSEFKNEERAGKEGECFRNKQRERKKKSFDSHLLLMRNELNALLGNCC